MDLLRVGHYSDHEKGTGVSVFLFEKAVPAVYCLCGSSPASRELPTLEPEASVTEIDAIVLSGGSAFGLATADGVMQWLREQGRGVKTPYAPVPIVPAACIFDLGIKTALSPTAENAYQACVDAKKNNFVTGSIGAGTGASVGKLIPSASCMSGGLGCAEVKTAKGLSVLAYAVVNCVGDVYDNGKIIAGARTKENKFANCQQHLLSGKDELELLNTNTTLVAVFTNAKFNKNELKRIAKTALTGMPHAIVPVFTYYDGDIVFCASLGEKVASEMVVGAMASEAVRQAIVSAVKNSITL